MNASSNITEADILAEVIAAEQGDLSPDVARSLLRWGFSQRAVKRMNKLAERNTKGTITDEERDELARYLRVGSLVNLVQAKARLSLAATAAS